MGFHVCAFQSISCGHFHPIPSSLSLSVSLLSLFFYETPIGFWHRNICQIYTKQIQFLVSSIKVCVMNFIIAAYFSFSFCYLSICISNPMMKTYLGSWNSSNSHRKKFVQRTKGEMQRDGKCSNNFWSKLNDIDRIEKRAIFNNAIIFFGSIIFS